MKKYLMTGIAALTLAGTFTSCSHDMDLYSGGDTSKKIIENYENAFVQTFGQPAPTQDWGFGSATVAGTRGFTRAIGDYADYKGSLTPEESYQDQTDWQMKTRPYIFPSGPESYPTGKPENASYYEGGYKYFNGGDIWMDENTSSHIEVQGYCNLYIVKSSIDEGNVNITPSANWYVGNVPYGSGEKIRVYICPGVTLTILPQFASNLQSNVEYYVCPGAQLICDANFKMNGTALYVAPGATATLQSLEVNNTGLTYNQGTITTEGKIYIANNVSVLVNDGSITAGSASAPTELEIAGGGRVQNNAEMNIYGDTFVSSNSAMWVNNGHWTTTYYTYIAGSFNVINNCYLEVREDFRMNLGDGQGSFRMDSGAGVLTKNLCAGGPFDGKDQYGNNTSYSGGPFRIDMGSNSVFKVTEIAHLNATKQNGYGFHGNGDSYAVFQAKDVVKETTGEANVTYAGKLYVSAETHFAQGYSGQYPFIKFEDGCSESNVYAAGFQSGSPDITISATPCNPGFGGNSGGGGAKPITETRRIIAEDLTLNDYGKDFDFNDVVFDVNWTHIEGNDDKNTQSVSIKIYAAGGELTMYVGGTAESLDGVKTVNDLFQISNPKKTISKTEMINTIKGHRNDYEPATYDLDNSWWSGTKIGEVAKSIHIRVIKSGEVIELSADQGKAASKIAVGTDYVWCDEREDIDTKFGGKFSQFVKGEGGYSWNTWYK